MDSIIGITFWDTPRKDERVLERAIMSPMACEAERVEYCIPSTHRLSAAIGAMITMPTRDVSR